MSHENIIRAWKDEEYRNSLSAEERALLPENPAGAIELNDEDLAEVVGGRPRLATSMDCYSARTAAQGGSCLY